MSSRVAIIAGAGRFPFHVAMEAKRQGLSVVAMGIQGWADPSLAEQVDAYEEIAVGQLGKLIGRLKSHDVHQAVMAGKVTKAVLLDPRTAFDVEALGILRQARELSVGTLLGAIGQRLASDGITLMDPSTFLQHSLCPLGVFTSRRPTAVEEADVQLGIRAARQLASLDIGQTVVVKRGVIVAVEALEGTDAAIRRAHALADGDLVVVKMASPDQDRRFDLPVVGTETITILRECRASCLAMEAQTALLLDRETLLACANAANLCLLGVAAPSA